MEQYWQRLLKGVRPELLDSLRLEKALINREGTRLMVCFFAPELISDADYDDVERRVRAAFPGRQVAVRVACPELGAQVERDITPYWDAIKRRALKTLPACRPFFRSCALSQDGRHVTLEFGDEAVVAFLINCHADKTLSRICEDMFKAHISFEFTCRGDMDERLRYISEMRKKDEELLMERLALEQKAAAAAHEKRKPALPQVLYGHAIDGEVMRMDSLAEDAGRVTVAGEVVSSEAKEVRDGALTILTFTVTDFTGTVYVKAFMRQKQSRDDAPAQPDPLLEYLKPGVCIKVRGQYRYDDFLRRWS